MDIENKITRTERLVLSAITECKLSQDTFCISFSQIAEKIQSSRSTAIRTIKSLFRKEIIHKELKSKNSISQYKIIKYTKEPMSGGVILAPPSVILAPASSKMTPPSVKTDDNYLPIELKDDQNMNSSHIYISNNNINNIYKKKEKEMCYSASGGSYELRSHNFSFFENDEEEEESQIIGKFDFFIDWDDFDQENANPVKPNIEPLQNTKEIQATTLLPMQEKPKGKRVRHVYADEFERFFSVYPSVKQKSTSYAIWKRKHLDEIADEIIEDVNIRIKSDLWVKGFIPNPTTYLNQERWEDEIIIKGKRYDKNRSENIAMPEKSDNHNCGFNGCNEKAETRPHYHGLDHTRDYCFKHASCGCNESLFCFIHNKSFTFKDGKMVEKI
jgi:DNA-binding Lrp family transcriptional regulator